MLWCHIQASFRVLVCNACSQLVHHGIALIEFSWPACAVQNAALDKEKMLWEAERAELKLAGEADKLQYGKLLRKYNQLIAKARQHGVTPKT